MFAILFSDNLLMLPKCDSDLCMPFSITDELLGEGTSPPSGRNLPFPRDPLAALDCRSCSGSEASLLLLGPATSRGRLHRFVLICFSNFLPFLY